MHWTWQTSEAVDTSCHEYTVASTVKLQVAEQGGQICTTCSVLLAYSRGQVLYATCFRIHRDQCGWVGSHIVLNV